MVVALVVVPLLLRLAWLSLLLSLVVVVVILCVDCYCLPLSFFGCCGFMVALTSSLTLLS